MGDARTHMQRAYVRVLYTGEARAGEARAGDARAGDARADVHGAHSCRSGRAMQRRPHTPTPPDFQLHERGIAWQRVASR